LPGCYSWSSVIPITVKGFTIPEAAEWRGTYPSI